MVDELLKMHHEVTVYPNEIPKYRYTFFDKINNLLSLHKKRISRKRENHLREESSREISQIISDTYDLIIVFRPDSYEKDFLIRLMKIRTSYLKKEYYLMENQLKVFLLIL